MSAQNVYTPYMIITVLWLVVCARLYSAACITTTPVNRGICVEMKDCMCSMNADERLKVFNIASLSHCDDEVPIEAFRRPPLFGYHLAKVTKHYLAIFLEYPASWNGDVFIHWFEGDMPGSEVGVGNVIGRRTMPYMPITSEVLADGAKHRYQLLLFEQPSKHMMRRIQTLEGHGTLDVSRNGGRRWKGLGDVLAKYGLCSQLVAGYQMRVSAHATGHLYSDMCAPMTIMEPDLHLGLQTRQSTSVASCRCVLNVYDASPLRFSFTNITCPASNCAWVVRVTSQIYERGCFVTNKTRRACCETFSCNGAYMLFGNNAVRLMISIEKQRANVSFQGRVAVFVSHEERGLPLIQARCGDERLQINDNCVSTTPSGSLAKSKLSSVTSKPHDLLMIEYTETGKVMTAALIVGMIVTIAMISEGLGIYFWDAKKRENQKKRKSMSVKDVSSKRMKVSATGSNKPKAGSSGKFSAITQSTLSASLASRSTKLSRKSTGRRQTPSRNALLSKEYRQPRKSHTRSSHTRV